MADHALQIWRNKGRDIVLATWAVADTFTEGWDKPDPYMGLYLKNGSASSRIPSITVRENAPKEHAFGFVSAENYVMAIPAGEYRVMTPSWFSYAHEEQQLVVLNAGVGITCANVRFPFPARMYGTAFAAPWMEQT